MTKYIRDRAGVPRGFGQNPVEWLHYMSKLEIDAEADGVKHRDVSLTAAVSSLKNRVLRLYQDAAKAYMGKDHTDWMRSTRNFLLTTTVGKICPQKNESD